MNTVHHRLSVRPRIRTLLALALLSLVATPVWAETYRMDLIVFLDKSVASEAGGVATLPSFQGAFMPSDVTALAAAGITVLPEEAFALQTEWQRLRNSRRYQPLVRLAWTQKDPPSTRGPSLRVRVGQALEVPAVDGYGSQLISPIEGTVALLLNQYLQLDSDLIYTMPVAGGYQSYPLRERRRMRRDEVHYIDSPRLGVLARVSKVTQE